MTSCAQSSFSSLLLYVHILLSRPSFQVLVECRQIVESILLLFLATFKTRGTRVVVLHSSYAFGGFCFSTQLHDYVNLILLLSDQPGSSD